MTQFAIGPALVASADVAGDQRASDATRLNSSGYAVAWTQDYGSPTSTIHVRTFDVDGRPTSQDLNLGVGSSGSLSALAAGGVAVAFSDNAANGAAIKLQLLEIDGTPRTAAITLEPTITPDVRTFQFTPDVTTLSDGRIAVVWSERYVSAGTAHFSTAGEILNSDGTVSVAAFQLGPSATNGFGYTNLDVTPLTNGGFALVRTRFDYVFGPGFQTGATEAQLFDASGRETTDVLLLASVSPNVSAATLPSGDFVVGYNSDFRVIEADGSVGAEHRVMSSSPLVSSGGPVEVAALPDGNILLTYGQSTDSVAGIYTPDGTRVGPPIQNVDYGIPVVLSQDKLVFVGTQLAHPSNINGALPYGSGADVLSRIATATFATSDADGTPLVNDGFYLARNGDVAAAGQDPDQHYQLYGWQEGRDPNALFSTDAYRFVNTDLRDAKIDPLQHYHESGWREGRDPSAFFDTQFYLASNRDVRAAGIDPFEHYLQYGRAEGREISAAITQGGISHGSFDPGFYLLSNVDVAKAAAAAGGDTFEFAYQHYQTYGWQEGRNPNAFFDTKGYLSLYTDVAAAKIDPLAHYDQYGWQEGRDPSALFDTTNYLTANNDVAAAGIDPLKHFLEYGAVEGRLALGDGLLN